MLKIIAGEYRSRRLREPRLDEPSRPYLHRIRESVFNLLRGWFEDASVLDLFAGVGTVGLEAVSRGASHVVLVEMNPQTHSHLVENIETLGCGDRAEAVLGDALSEHILFRAPKPVDLMFVDPPYPMMADETSRARVFEQIERCRVVLAEQSFVILRSPVGPNDADMSIPGYDGPEPHDYGRDKWVLLYQPSAEQASENHGSA